MNLGGVFWSAKDLWSGESTLHPLWSSTSILSSELCGFINRKTQGASLGSNGKGDGVETTVANVFSEAGRQGGVKAVAPPGLLFSKGEGKINLVSSFVEQWSHQDEARKPPLIGKFKQELAKIPVSSTSAFTKSPLFLILLQDIFFTLTHLPARNIHHSFADSPALPLAA